MPTHHGRDYCRAARRRSRRLDARPCGIPANAATKAHWNNEVAGLRLWINAEQGWQANSHLFALPNPPQPTSRETRTLEFELLAPAESAPGTYALRVYALYYVCEDVNGTCLYRRQDIPLQVKVRQPVQ